MWSAEDKVVLETIPFLNCETDKPNMTETRS